MHSTGNADQSGIYSRNCQGRNGVEAASQANSYGQRRIVEPTYFSNEVDTWIDELDENRSSSTMGVTMSGITPDMLMSSLVQQFLPQVKIPRFSGAPLE